MESKIPKVRIWKSNMGNGIVNQKSDLELIP